jgi:hypothetical protein
VQAAFYRGFLETPENYEESYDPYVEAILDIIDSDKDGKLTEEDEVKYCRVFMSVPESDARSIFKNLDQDGDGFIGKRDLLNGIKEAYFGNKDDPECPVHWILGPLDSPLLTEKK